MKKFSGSVDPSGPVRDAAPFLIPSFRGDETRYNASRFANNRLSIMQWIFSHSEAHAYAEVGARCRASIERAWADAMEAWRRGESVALHMRDE